ncbi:hypothetical protein MTO96_023309 [Rhipicephalus appendiculatus]
MTLTDEDMTVVTTEPAGTEVLVFDAAGKHHRRRRRGKKRRQGRDDPDAALSSSDASSPVKCSPTKQRKKQVMIRPREVPKAPANFTQFIIDDHENCALYQSFEAYPNNNGVSGNGDFAADDACVPDDSRSSSGDHYHHHYGTHVQDSGEEGQPQSGFPSGEDYECLDYGNMMQFYEKDFEVVYRSARSEELMRLTRAEVIERYEALERRASELYDELHKLDPQNCLDELQRQLLRLQDENQALMKLNVRGESGVRAVVGGLLFSVVVVLATDSSFPPSSPRGSLQSLLLYTRPWWGAGGGSSSYYHHVAMVAFHLASHGLPPEKRKGVF